MRGVVVRQSSSTLHLAHDRIKGAVRVLRGAEVAQARVWLGGEPFEERGRQPRFADTGLAGKEHHLALTGLCSRPAPKQQFEFFFPPDEGSQTGRVQRLEAAFHRSRSQRRPGPRRPCNALEVFCPEVLKLKQTAEKPSRALGYNNHVRLGDPLQPRRKVRRLAHDRLLLGRASANEVAHDNEPSGNADAGLQRGAGVETGNRRD